jgi:hypothetical protein
MTKKVKWQILTLSLGVLMSSTTALFIKVSGLRMDLDKAKEFNFGRMAASILVIGNKIKPMAKED